MNISYNWLKQYLNTGHSVEKLSEILTSIGLEVEGVHPFSSVPGGLQGLLVGEVTACGAHPNADKLSLTKVSIGSGELLSIVCGAPNVAAGQKVVVATVGTTIYPVEGDPFTIKKAKIRGERSEGMICAEDEIGIGQSHDGIMVLDGKYKAGTPLSEIFEVEEDWIFDIGLTPNRSDATSHLGVAEDLLAWMRVNEDFKGKIQYPSAAELKKLDDTSFTVVVEDYNSCPRYSGLLIKNILVKESPEWLKNRLKSIGVRPLNNVVDITNFVLHEYGQPLHAFDLKKIKGNGIVVTQLPQNTPFVTLDEKERKLDASDLMICNARREPLCIAGVFGGLGSGVDENTTDLFLESAHFDASSVRKTSTRHLLRTDAAKVFEKGSDPEITVTALRRAAGLIAEIAGGEPASGVFDLYPEPAKPAKIELVPDRVRKLTGTNLSDNQIVEILIAMNMGVEKGSGESLIVSVPTNKSDVLREADLLEEILRIYGYDRVPFSDSIQIPLIPGSHPDKFLISNKIADYLCSRGLLQMMNLSLVRSEWYESDRNELVFIHNTSNESLNAMRPDMLHPSLQTIAYNVNRRQTELRLFEIGRTYALKEGKIIEREHIAIALSGSWNIGNWKQHEEKSDFYRLIHLVRGMGSMIGLDDIELKDSQHPWFDYGADLYSRGQFLGRAGRVSAELCSQHDLEEEVFFADLDWKMIVDAARRNKLASHPVSKFPSVSRDLALILDDRVEFKEVESLVLQTGGKKIASVELFDIYRDDEKLGSGKKSYAVNMVFSDPDKTLKDKEVDKMVKKILHRLNKEIGADLR